MAHIDAFSDELVKIASAATKQANLSAMPSQYKAEPNPRALGVTNPTTPKNTLKGKITAYAKPKNLTAPAPIAANYQPTSPAPPVTT